MGPCGLDTERERNNLWYATLPSREKYVLYLIEQLHPRESPTDMRPLVLSRSAFRAARDAPNSGKFMCAMPRQKVWLEWLDRWQTGMERMMIQGFFENAFKSKGFTNAQLSDLGGNAVGIPVCAAIHLALLDAFIDIL